MADPADIQRLIGDLAREGTVVSVDHEAGTCRVRFADDLTTGDIPWLCARAGATRTWSPPSAGEQVAVLCPEGDTARGILIGSLSSDANPHAANDTSTLSEFSDGARIGYDPAVHVLTAILPAGAIARVEASGGIVLKGPVEIDGTLTVRDTIDADGEITGKGVKLSMHKHGLVKAGTDQSGVPA
ncbi:phage baseplate assembly protein V [Sphingomonas hylomeconis]|uniref:Phage baseplate assembly protein V n=1 Tax=Sphingomonas hylomeconis TaxID=1395958 RepID=A0ABV7SRD4_9SPHN|nr:phage baseplate assembly protein V [Sphingomonas hylomeconis]